MTKLETFIIVERYLVKGEGWKTERTEVTGTYEGCGSLASMAAHVLDAKYGDDHFWSVDLMSPNGGSFFQLFHGRLF